MKLESHLPEARVPIRVVRRRFAAADVDPPTVEEFALSIRPVRSLLHAHLSITEVPDTDDGPIRASSLDDTSGLAAASGASANTISSGALQRAYLSRLLGAIVSGIVAQFLRGCATYAVAMYGIPSEWGEQLDRRDSASGPSLEHDESSDVWSHAHSRSESVAVDDEA